MSVETKSHSHLFVSNPTQPGCWDASVFMQDTLTGEQNCREISSAHSSKLRDIMLMDIMLLCWILRNSDGKNTFCWSINYYGRRKTED